jgi:enoyl-CoA hydratase
MFVTEETWSHTTILTIRRPERLNALGTDIGRALNQALDRLATAFTKAKPSCKLVVLTAEEVKRPSANIWIAGGDLKELSGLAEGAQGRAYAESFSKACQKLEALPVPAVAAIHGNAIGGGAELALGCDLRLATRESALVFKQLEIGLPTGYGATRRLVELVGKSRATEIMFLCRTLSANKAHELGIVHETFASKDEMLSRLKELDQHFGKLSFEAVAAQKAMLRGALQDRTAAFAEELELFQSAWMNPTHKANVQKFK